MPVVDCPELFDHHQAAVRLHGEGRLGCTHVGGVGLGVREGVDVFYPSLCWELAYPEGVAAGVGFERQIGGAEDHTLPARNDAQQL